MSKPNIIVDENLSPLIAQTLNSTFVNARFRSARELNVEGVEDVDVIATAAAQGCNGILTLDGRQLVNGEEREALRECGMHWVGAPQSRTGGIAAIARLTAAFLVALPIVFERWDEEPTAFTLKLPHAGDEAIVRSELL